MDTFSLVVNARQAIYERFSKELMTRYPAVVVGVDNGFQASHPDLPGCEAEGATPAEAFTALAHVRRIWLCQRLTLGHPIPVPEHQRTTTEEQQTLRTRVLECA